MCDTFFTGIDIPKCNFVMRYDFPKNYQSYIQCKSRARAMDALHVLLVPREASKECIWQLAQYQYIEKVSLAALFYNPIIFNKILALCEASIISA